jgi:O-antigen/teichoic acid export membrane protein
VIDPGPAGERPSSGQASSAGRVEPGGTIGGSERVMSNTAALLASRLLVAAMGWAGTLLIVRSLSRTSWGQFSFVFSTLALLYIVTNAVGPRVAIGGLLERADREAFAGSYAILRALLGVLGYGIAVGFVVVAGYPPVVVKAMLIAGAIIIVSSTSGSYVIVFQVHQDMRQPAIAQVLGQVAQLALTVLLVLDGAGILPLVTPAVLCELVILAWTLRAVRKLLSVRYRILWSTWGALARSAVPVALGQGFFAIYASIDTVLLSKLQDFQAVGVYSVAYKFANVVTMVPIALSTAVLGGLVSSWPDDPERFWGAIRRSIGTLYLLGAAITAEFAIFARPVVELLYGDYAAASVPSVVVVAASCLGFFSMLMTTALTAQGRMRPFVLIGAFGLVTNVAANLLVIPRWSYTGAAWVTLGTEAAVVACLTLFFLHGRLTHVLPGRQLARSTAAAATGLGVGLALRPVVPWPVALLVSGIVLLVSLHLMRAPGPRGLPSLLEG